MNLSVFGGRRTKLPSGWTNQTSVSVLGGTSIDATAPPGDGAKLTVIGVLGGVHVELAPGTQVDEGGFSLFGGRRISVTVGDGPLVHLRAYTILGGVRVASS